MESQEPTHNLTDDLVTRALLLINNHSGEINISFLQRHLRIGYSAALMLMSELIDTKVIEDHGSNLSAEVRYTIVKGIEK